MRKIGDIFQDLGFNKDASDDVKKAFVKHLVRAADRSSVQNSSSISKQVAEKKSVSKLSDTQLSFDPEILKAK